MTITNPAKLNTDIIKKFRKNWKQILKTSTFINPLKTLTNVSKKVL